MRRHKGNDGWSRSSYDIPDRAVMGSSNTGMGKDSPCPSDKVRAELDSFCAVLDKEDIKHKYEATQSGNIFMTKVWVVVEEDSDLEKAKELSDQYLIERSGDTRFIHDATD